MRNLLILGGIGILSTAAWTVIADDGASGYGKMHACPGHDGLEYHMRHGGGHFAIAGQLGMFFPTPPELFTWESEPGPAWACPRAAWWWADQSIRLRVIWWVQPSTRSHTSRCWSSGGRLRFRSLQPPAPA